MADSLRLTGEPDAPAPHVPVMIGGTGEFGRRVAGFLSAWRPDAREFDPADGIDAAFDALAGTGGGAGAGSGASVGAGAIVLALWRPEPALCERADELSFRHSVPWLPVTMEHPVIRVGPCVRPPTGPCFRCYVTRKAQHDQQPWITAAMDAAYQRDAACGPRGYLPQHARLAAALALEALDALDTGTTSARPPAGGLLTGEVVTVGLVSGGVQASPVLAVHSCDRCDAPRLSAGLGLLAELATREHVSQAVRSPADGYPA